MLEGAVKARSRTIPRTRGHLTSWAATGVLAALFALLPLVASGADGIGHRRPVVLVLVYSSGPEASAQLGALISDSLAVDLESQGIQVVPSNDSAVDDRAVAFLAGKNHADYALWGTYSLAGSEIRLDARWIDPARAAAVAAVSRTGALDFSFDAVVASLVGELVESQKMTFADLPAQPDQIAELPVTTASQQPVISRGVNLDPVGRPSFGPAALPPKAEPAFVPFAISLGSSPFIATFAALNYFPVGLDISFTALYRFRTAGGLIGIGLGSGVSGFHGKGAYAEADFSVIPIGIDLLYGTRTGSFIDFFAHIGGGPAIFSAKLTSGEFLSKVIPYATGGLGIQLSFFQSLGISLEAAYTCFFDSPDPIMGFAPSLSIDLRL